MKASPCRVHVRNVQWIGEVVILTRTKKSVGQNLGGFPAFVFCVWSVHSKEIEVLMMQGATDKTLVDAFTDDPGEEAAAGGFTCQQSLCLSGICHIACDLRTNIFSLQRVSWNFVFSSFQQCDSFRNSGLRDCMKLYEIGDRGSIHTVCCTLEPSCSYSTVCVCVSFIWN